MRFVRRDASPRSRSGMMSSLGLKKSVLPSNRDGKVTGQLKIHSRSRKIFITLGAVDATRMSAGLDAALMMRCQQLSGIANMEPRPHSNVWGFLWSSVHTSVVPRRIERAGARHLDHVAAPFALSAVELDEGAVATHPVPALERDVLHASHP